ncbi:MAG TPA: hypothetical protein VGC71_01285, partial [Gaiellales bacterium]
MPVFKTGAFNRSATPPGSQSLGPQVARQLGQFIASAHIRAHLESERGNSILMMWWKSSWS